MQDKQAISNIKMWQVTEQIELQYKLLEELWVKISKLYDKLSPVIDYSNLESCDENEQVRIVPLADTVRNHNKKIQDKIYTIDSLIEWIEL